MPIPPHGPDGLLPLGIHQASLEEILARFGRFSDQRELIAESLGWAVDAARRAGVIRFIVDGSFVDDKRSPNDADCVLLQAPDYPRDAAAARELEGGLPYLQLILIKEKADFDRFVALQFGTDRQGRTRGFVEVAL